MFEINNRRYLGSKTKLLNFIEEIIEKHCHDCKSFMDLFGGTGVVGYHFNKKFNIIAIIKAIKSIIFSPAPPRLISIFVY